MPGHTGAVSAEAAGPAEAFRGFAGDALADRARPAFTSQLDDDAGEFVAEDDGRPQARVPLDVGPADARRPDLDLDFVRTRGRLRHLSEPDVVVAHAESNQSLHARSSVMTNGLGKRTRPNRGHGTSGR